MAKSDIQTAAEAHTTLCIFASIVSIINGNDIFGAEHQAAAEDIARICHERQALALDEYDAAVARAALAEGGRDE